MHHHLVRVAHAPAGGPRDRVGRAAQRPQRRRPDRLRRGGGQPVPDARDARRARRRRPAAEGDDGRGGAAPRGQGNRQGPAEDDVEDGHLDDAVVLRRADLRGGRASRPSSSSGTSPGTASRIGGIGIETLAEETLARHARAYPGLARRAAAGRRPLRLAARRRAPPVEPGDDRAAPARGPARRLRRRTRSTRRTVNTRERAPADDPRPPRVQVPPRTAASRSSEVEPAQEIVKRFVDRRDVARLAVARGARDARDRDEPHRRQVEHRRGRRGSGALHARRERRLAPLGDQAGRVGPLRREHQLPDERRRAADQDGAGREARRGRPAARATRSTATSRACG